MAAPFHEIYNRKCAFSETHLQRHIWFLGESWEPYKNLNKGIVNLI